VSYLEWPRRVAALGQFRVLDPQRPQLSAPDEHHLRTVLRVRHGEEVVVTNGAGSWALCEVGDTLTRVTPVHKDPETATTTIYMAPLKGDRSEWAVAKATELGVTRIVPLISDHLIVKFKGETRDKIVTRWRRIGEEACGQCRRTYDVEITDPVSVADVPSEVCVADFDGDSDWNGVTAVAIGPEGGWAPREWGEDRRRLALGPTVLRGETAGIVAAALLSFGAGGWGFTLGAQASQ
jgi:16S rRNA (uracil1498-N3)-methyltransferase